MNRRKTKTFPVDAVMSLITGVLVSERGFSVVHELAEWMSNGPVWTHQIPRISKEAAKVMLAIHPSMQDAIDEAKQVNAHNWREWLSKWSDRYGDLIAVPVMSIAEHERIDPMSELSEKVHPDRIVSL